MAGGVSSRIAGVQRKVRQEYQTPANGTQTGMRGKKQVQQLVPVVRSRDGLAEFLHNRLQVLLGRLLTMKAHAVMKRRGVFAALSCDEVVGLGFLYPLPGQVFHREPCPAAAGQGAAAPRATNTRETAPGTGHPPLACAPWRLPTLKSVPGIRTLRAGREFFFGF